MNKRELKLSKFTLFSLLFFASSIFILIISKLNKQFADFFNVKISSVFRLVLADISRSFPFSLAELLVFLSPIIITLVIIANVKKRNVSVSLYLSRIISFFLIFFSLYVFSFGIGYHTEDFYDRFGIKKEDASLTDLKNTAMIIASRLNTTNDLINYDSDNFSVMPYDISTLNKKLNIGYKVICEKYSFMNDQRSKIKPVLMSKTLSRAHITGLYSFFTGEVNINLDFPDYTIPYTVAHEFAHQRGIAREDEANIVAFLVCINSSDEYLKYSALINAFEYVTSALNEASPEAFYEVYATLDEQIKKELHAYSDFYKKYENSTSGKIGTKIGNAYLMLNGETEGVRSYGLVAELLVAYFDGKIG